MVLATEIVFTLNNGNKFPGLGLGTVNSGEAIDVKAQVKTAIKAGYRHIDTAWFYGTEKFVGEGINESIAEGVIKREDLFVTTKVWPSYHDNPEASLNESLEALNLDYVDLLLQHWPLTFKNTDGKGRPGIPKLENGDTDLDTSSNFIDFYKRIEQVYLNNKDKVKSIGVSNYSVANLTKLLAEVETVPVVNQIEYHPQLPQQDLIDLAAKHGIITTAYSPVGSRGAPVIKLPLIVELAEKYDVTTNEVANAYHLLQGRATLPRSSNLDRIRTNIRLPPLTKDELDQLYQIGAKEPKRHVGKDWAPLIGFEVWE